MVTERSETAWIFGFGLEAADGRDIPQSVAEELLEHLVEWAEVRGLSVGGGYHGDSEQGRSEEVDRWLSNLTNAD